MTLSVRLEPEIEQAFENEVRRLKTTKSQFVNQLLREALRPKDPIELLMELREQYGIPTPGPNTPRTNRSSNVKQLVREAVGKKFREGRAG